MYRLGIPGVLQPLSRRMQKASLYSSPSKALAQARSQLTTIWALTHLACKQPRTHLLVRNLTCLCTLVVEPRLRYQHHIRALPSWAIQEYSIRNSGSGSTYRLHCWNDLGYGAPAMFLGLHADNRPSGGLLSQSPGSWRSIFWLQAGLGCVLVISGWFVLPNEDTSKRYKGLDWIGALLSTAGFGLLTYDLA